MYLSRLRDLAWIHYRVELVQPLYNTGLLDSIAVSFLPKKLFILEKQKNMNYYLGRSVGDESRYERECRE